jgi:hypothetical protein
MTTDRIEHRTLATPFHPEQEATSIMAHRITAALISIIALQAPPWAQDLIDFLG